MALVIPSTEPRRVFQATRWTWTKTFSDFSPAGGWSLVYRFRSPTHEFEITPNTVDGVWTVTHEPAATLDVPAGDYRWHAIVSHFTDGQFVADEGTITVEADLATAVEGYETRTFARRMLDAIEARLEGTADRDDLSYSTEGLTVSRYSPEQLEERRRHYRALVVQEERTEAAANGRFHSGRIFTRLP